ncbi:hypothetical protein CSUB01_06385 [Colletotrichum sublineola]|uniref:Uncharacterized protein n=1 Tax=Colletotrichum sublineola TaxID=1173701 RepID=A0A066X3F6_COLSU|nr:hypothetical protein CSUB01_06385 [Colletotrichum sublineola]
MMQTPLFLAHRALNDVEFWQSLCKKGANINAEDKDGRSALSIVAMIGNARKVEMLLEKDDIHVNHQDKRSQTPLSLASEEGHVHVIKLLLEKDHVDPNLGDQRGKSPLTHAVVKRHKHVVELLLQKNHVNPNLRDNDGWTPLSWAAQKGYDDVAKLLLQKDEIVLSLQDTNGWTPLSLAAGYKHKELFWLLLNASRNERPKARSSRTQLSWAAENGHESMVKMLLEGGDDPNIRNGDDSTSLSWAAENGHESVVKVLLEGGADPNIRNGDDSTPLLRAVKSGHKRVAKLLAQHDITTLHPLVQKGEIVPVKLIIAANYDINTTDSFGWTALHMATFFRHIEMAKMLISSGADVNAKDINGTIPLSLAISSRQHDFIELLLTSSACPRGITVNEWLRVYGKDSSDTLVSLSEGADGGMRLRFIEETMDIPPPVPETERRLLSHWKTRDYFSMLSIGWIPDEGIDLFSELIAVLKSKWSETCYMAERHLSKRRIDQLSNKGKSPDFIPRLAEDAKSLAELRNCFRDQVHDARNFVVDYCHDKGEREDAKAISNDQGSLAAGVCLGVDQRSLQIDEYRHKHEASQLDYCCVSEQHNTQGGCFWMPPGGELLDWKIAGAPVWGKGCRAFGNDGGANHPKCGLRKASSLAGSNSADSDVTIQSYSESPEQYMQATCDRLGSPPLLLDLKDTNEEEEEEEEEDRRSLGMVDKQDQKTHRLVAPQTHGGPAKMG